jgi:hypothetical protein
VKYGMKDKPNIFGISIVKGWYIGNGYNTLRKFEKTLVILQ